MKRKLSVDIYFGVPGSGKTTFAAWLTKRCLKHKIPVYSNVPITGSYRINPHEDLGKFQISDAQIIIDEAGIDYNNRSYKTLALDEITYFKYHRHYRPSIAVFSQSYDDMDITLRRLAQSFYVVSKAPIPFFVMTRKIGRKVGINETTKEICDEYFFKPLGFKLIFAPLTWKYFNTYSSKPLPVKEFDKW